MELYRISKTMIGRKYTQTTRIAGKEGEIYRTQEEIRCVEYFEKFYAQKIIASKNYTIMTQKEKSKQHQ